MRPPGKMFRTKYRRSSFSYPSESQSPITKRHILIGQIESEIIEKSVVKIFCNFSMSIIVSQFRLKSLKKKKKGYENRVRCVEKKRKADKELTKKFRAAFPTQQSTRRAATSAPTAHKKNTHKKRAAAQKKDPKPNRVTREGEVAGKPGTSHSSLVTQKGLGPQSERQRESMKPTKDTSESSVPPKKCVRISVHIY